MQSNASQSPASVTLSHTEDSPQSVESVRTSPLHRDLMRDTKGASFDSPSPVMGSDHSVGDYNVSSPTTDLPKLGVNTPPVQEVDDLEDDMGHLTLDRGGKERYVGKSSPMFYMRRHWGGNHHEPEKPSAKKFIENPDLPSPEVMTHLLNLHFTYVHPFAPVFVWSKFLKRLQSRDYTPSFLLLLNSIFALASRYSDDVSFRTDPSKPETIGAQFSEKAKMILDTLYDEPDLYCVGALILLAFQQMGTGGSYKSWIYVGLSIRMAQHLGLNRDCLKLNPHMPALDREERNRVWWTVFMADRIISTSFGRPQVKHCQIQKKNLPSYGCGTKSNGTKVRVLIMQLYLHRTLRALTNTMLTPSTLRVSTKMIPSWSTNWKMRPRCSLVLHRIRKRTLCLWLL